MQLLRDIYPEIKQLLKELEISRGNMLYYSSIVKTISVFHLRRTSKWQGLLYLSCYIFFRYRESNDRLVSCFNYLVRKHHEQRVEYARTRVAKEVEVIQDKLKSAGDILSYFTDTELDDALTLGELRQKVFCLMNQEEIRLVSDHLINGKFNRTTYQWEFTESQSRKIAGSLRMLFCAIDVRCEDGDSLLSQQIITARTELQSGKKLKTINHDLVKDKDLNNISTGGLISPSKFKYYLYRKVSGQIESGSIYVNESERNRRLEDDLIPLNSWSKNKANYIDKTGLEKLSTPIEETLSALQLQLSQKLEQVNANINSDANEFVQLQPRSNRLTWSLANKRWKTPIDNPVYSQPKHMGIIDIMNYVNRKTGYLDAFKNLALRDVAI